MAALAIFVSASITMVYGALVALLSTVLRPYNIEASLGRDLVSVLFLGVGFSVLSALSWSINVCI